MAETKVIMPQMGESIFEGTITKWLKKKGERIERDEPASRRNRSARTGRRSTLRSTR